MGDVPQSVYQSNQNYATNVRLQFKHYVTGGNTPNDNEPGENVGIDDIRGQISISVTGTKTEDLISALNIDPAAKPASTQNTTTQVTLAQESRCHAFYRIIGFPVVSSDQSQFYNPGLDVIKQPGVTRTITLATKISIAKNVGKKFEAISGARESWVANTSQVFSVPESVEAGVLALTSGTYGSQGNVNLRKFASPFIQNTALDPFDYAIEHQTYATATLSSLVGGREVLLSLYQDANGSFPNINVTTPSIFFQHQHIIVPFLVDPRIDFSIWASESKTSDQLSKRIAVPFVPDSSFLMAGSTATSERPLLEQIITQRAAQFNQSQDAGGGVQSVVDFMKTFKEFQTGNIGNTPISSIFSNKVLKTSQVDDFKVAISTIQALMKVLVLALQTVQKAQGKYYWLPIPSTSGPEGGCSVRPVPLNENFSSDLMVVPGDIDIAFNQAQVLFSSLSTAVTEPNAVPDKYSQFPFAGSFSFDSKTSNSQGDLSSKTQDALSEKRDKQLKKASQALQIIEMIMGEFSGLGLSDILVVVRALYIMPLEDVLGFLDDDAYARAKIILGQSLPARTAIVPAMKSLAQTVNGLYQIMDQIFINYLSNGGLDQ